MKRALAVAAMAAVTLAMAAPARADAYLRVTSQEASVRTGPSATFREIDVVRRGQVFEVVARSRRGYWFRIAMEDGTEGWIFGETAFPFEVVSNPGEAGFFSRTWDGIRGALFAPPAVMDADFAIAASGGSLGGEGIFSLHPAWVADPRLALEGWLSLSPRAQENVFAAGLGWTLRLIPDAVIGPYLHLGAGAVFVRPKADNVTGESDTLLAVRAAGGLELSFKKQITVRIDVANWSVLDPNRAQNAQEVSGGLAIFF